MKSIDTTKNENKVTNQESNLEESNSSKQSFNIVENNPHIRPKRNNIIEYSVNGETKVGRVTRVGKQSGRDKFRCWIKHGENEDSFDFATEVDEWKILKKKVQFHENVNQSENENDEEKDEDATNETYITLIPAKYHDDPEVIKAKEEELSKWNIYDAFEEVEEDENQHIISSKWVIAEKDDATTGGKKVKARLCVRGFEEETHPKSDSPTASHDSFKLFLAIAATEGFRIRALDVTSAFLQGTPLERDVFMEPPAERKKNGFVWKLKKGAYGLYDASRQWFLAVKKELLDIGMRQLSGDEAVFHLIKDHKLIGICALHMDDFLTGGTLEFEKNT